jgi:ABC-type glutathione transport system ATPase component
MDPDGKQMRAYAGHDTFRARLDEAADQPALGFAGYARALSQIIFNSKPRFAIGIFGDSGCDKTTLMRAISAELDNPETVVKALLQHLAVRARRAPHRPDAGHVEARE